MADLLDIWIPDAPPARQSLPCKQCGAPATHTLAHWMKYAADIRAERAKGRTGAVHAAHYCDDCSSAYRASIDAENKTAHDAAMKKFAKDFPHVKADEVHPVKTQAACDAPPHGGFTIMPLPEAKP